MSFILHCFLLVLFIGFADSATDPNDQAALVAFYNSLTGTDSLAENGWSAGISSGDLCAQGGLGVNCLVPSGICCSTDGRVIALRISSPSIVGPISTQLGNLGQLHVLDLSINTYSGTIPAALGNLTQLTDLHLYECQLNGNIPTELGKLTLLQALSFDNNKLNGHIPTELGLLLKLEELDLSNNNLDGNIPTQLGALTKLTSLYLHKNQLNGNIPTDLSKLMYLQILALSYNELSGAIPTQLGDLSQLIGLNLDHNKLTGDIPQELNRLTPLQLLFLNHNLLTGTIPNSIITKPNLQYLYFSDNHLTCPPSNTSLVPKNDFAEMSSLCGTICSANKCLHGGICSIIGNPLYDASSCVCPNGYSGANCQNTPCSSTPCKNGATCNLDGPNYTCSCSTAFRGKTCQLKNPLGTTTIPIVYYSFSSANKERDESGNGHNLEPFLSPSMRYPLNYDPDNEALVFFGQDLLSTFVSPISLGNYFTISIVFSISTITTTTSLFFLTQQDLLAERAINLMIAGDKSLTLNVGSELLMKTSLNIIGLNTPYFVTLMRNGDTWRLFQNGVAVATKIKTIATNLVNHNIFIGYNFLGIIDEFAVYNTNLAPAQIKTQSDLLSLPTQSCSGCLNGAICGTLNSGKQCFCSQCYSGNNCNTQQLGCNNPCLNGGQYIDDACQCASGYFGSVCAFTVNCPAISKPTGIFPETPAYRTVLGSCPEGKTGTPQRHCLPNGYWKDTSAPCV